ncbi:xaa-Arg dipeptidase-like isoform X2 [Dermacentor variabilis]|uniref:xaa-Arg dipeptidase-like isoform X2 n=1 Tax=Dermacentor variabilis TaxID=34621 RepID=UPI003F5B5036
METYACIVEAAINSRADTLTLLGQYLWRNPELAFAEVKAHDYISSYLENEGFKVARNYVLPTAFRAQFGDGDVTVAVLCEYDALPGLGHACGHNLIAQGSVAVAVAVKEALRRAPLRGKVVLLGTPAEEGGGGKVHLLKAGAFEGIHFALMAHPSTRNVAACGTTSATKYAVTYKGLPAHSAAAPWQGRNALDAAVAAYVNVALLRQQISPECRVSGLRFPDGDDSPASSASTDVGNVSHTVPTIQPYYTLEAVTSGGNHTEGFREASNDQRSYDVTLKVAKALALTAVRVMSDSLILTDVRSEFASSLNSTLDEGRVRRSSTVKTLPTCSPTSRR